MNHRISLTLVCGENVINFFCFPRMLGVCDFFIKLKGEVVFSVGFS